jgi:stage II sporulation protein M
VRQLTLKHELRFFGNKKDRSFLLRLLLLALFFLAGVILGQVLAGKVPTGTADELTQYLKDYFSLNTTAETASRTFLSALMIYLRYPVLAFLLGFASVGIVLLPVLTVAYGFFLSFSVCCFTAAFGSGGVLLALSVFGLRCLITLPCYFFLAVPSFQNAVSLAANSFGRKKQMTKVRYGSVWWIRLCIVLAVLLAGVLVEILVTPRLLSLVLTKILT